jgi:predicted GIY-YIG superfamily endonuclease
MKKYYVYEIINLLGTVEYVGETTMPKRRFYAHTKIPKKIGVGSGRFYNRSDIFMNIVKEFDNKKEAFQYQIQLQKEYGLDTDLDKLRKNGFKKNHPFHLKNNYTKVKGYDSEGNCVGTFESIGDAARILNIKKAGVWSAANGNIKKTKGYSFVKI